MFPIATSIGLDYPDAAGADVRPLGVDEISELERILHASGLEHVSLARRHSVVFAFPGMGMGNVYPELAGCTTEVCAFIEEAAIFERHGIQVVGISTEPSEPPPGCLAIPFPNGLLPQEGVGAPLEFVERGGRRYAVRASFVIGPDGSGVRIGGITDVVAHVRRCLDVAVEQRLARYREATFTYLRRDGTDIGATARLRGLLPNGADSVAIPRVDLTVELVAKLASPDIVSQEAGYMDRINRLLEGNGKPPLFPRVVAVGAEEEPAWYLMEAADPTTADQLAFADPRRTVLSHRGEQITTSVLERLADLYVLTFRPEVPAVAPYHYLGRFQALPRRSDFAHAFELLIGGDLERFLRTPVGWDSTLLRSYQDQLGFLEEAADLLVQPVGAYLHGDPHLPNVLLTSDGAAIRLIDPRVVWDGHDVGDPGFGDPVYDLATLFHSIGGMSTILHAISNDHSAALLEIEEGVDGLVARSGILDPGAEGTIEWFSQTVERIFPTEILGQHWRARLHVGAANALLGWLKYPRSISTKAAWLAVYVLALHHLETGRRELASSEVLEGR